MLPLKQVSKVVEFIKQSRILVTGGQGRGQGEAAGRGVVHSVWNFIFARRKSFRDWFHNSANILNAAELVKLLNTTEHLEIVKMVNLC